MLVKQYRPNPKFFHILMAESVVDQIRHSGVAHKIHVCRIGHMPIGIEIAPTDVKTFFEYFHDLKIEQIFEMCDNRRLKRQQIRCDIRHILPGKSQYTWTGHQGGPLFTLLYDFRFNSNSFAAGRSQR